MHFLFFLDQAQCKKLMCDAIWENPPHVPQGSFVEINKIILKLLGFTLFFINFDDTMYVTWDVGIIVGVGCRPGGGTQI